MFWFAYIMTFIIPCLIVLLIFKISENNIKILNRFIKPGVLKKVWILIPIYLAIVICISIGIRNLDLATFSEVPEEEQIAHEEFDKLDRGMRLESINFDEIIESELIVTGDVGTFKIKDNQIDAYSSDFDYIAVKENKELKDEIKIRVSTPRYIEYLPYYIDITNDLKIPTVRVIDNKIILDKGLVDQNGIHVSSFKENYYNNEYYNRYNDILVYRPTYCIITIEVPIGTKVNTHSFINVQESM